jgi:hypothetical protein
MSRSFLLIGVVATVWAIGITLADKTPSQASNVKQRGDQIITSEDDLVAPAAPDDTKKNEVDTTKDAKAPSKPNYKKGPTKYSSSKKSNGKGKERYRDYPSRPEKKKQVRPQRYHPVRQPYKGNARPVRPRFEKPPQRIPQPAQRRDSGYGAPVAPQPQVIIKQAGPSKQYAWVGHQPYHNPGHDVPGHVFAAANLPKWTLMGSNIFQANLLYPGDPAGAKETYKPPPAPAPAPAQPAAPAEPAPAYDAPAPAPAYNAPAPAAPSYGPPEPAASLSYDAPVPAPVYNSYEAPTTAAPAPPPVYQPSPSPAAVYVGQPSYVPSYPSIQYVPAQPTPATPTAAPTSAPAPAIYNNFPSYSALPQTPSYAPILPAVAGPPANVYNVPIKVEEAPLEEEDEVFYIFYEDKKPEASYEAPTYQSPPTQNDISSYIVEDVQASKTPLQHNQFNAPNPNDIRTVYVPFESAVNIPNTYDVSVASNFGFSSGAPSQQAGTGAAPPNYSGFPNFPASAAPPSYDSSISSYDAPILDDNSYTAKSPINLGQPLWYQDTLGIQQHDKKKGAHSTNRLVRNVSY